MVTFKSGFFIFVVLLIYSPFPLYANDSTGTFQIRDYIPAPYKYRSLRVSPGLSFSGGNSTSDAPYSSYTDYYEYHNFGDNFGSSVNHRFAYYSKSFEYYYSNYLNISYSGSKNKDFDVWDSERIYYDEDKVRRFSYSSNIHNNLYKYFGKRFFGGITFSPNIRHTPYDLSVREDKRIIKNISNIDSSTYSYTRNDDKKHTVSVDLNCNISIGLGRINDVTYAVVALNMLDRINSLKKGKPVTADIQPFAQYIEKLKRKRKYDLREALIDDIDSIYSYLKDKKVIDSCSSTARLIMELYDQWKYAGYPIRESGYKFKFYPECTVELNWNKVENKFIDGSRIVTFKDSYTMDYMEQLDEIDTGFSEETGDWGDHSINAFICSEYFLKKPLNRYFQFDTYLLGKFGFVRKYDFYKYEVYPPFGKGNVAYPTGEARISFIFGYYPNTRTRIRLSAYAEYLRDWDYYLFEFSEVPPETKLIHDVRNLTIGSDLYLVYYISPRFSYNVQGSVTFNDYYNVERYAQKGIRFSLGAGLSYDIF